MTRSVNGTSLSSQVNYTFKVTNNIESDSDHDGVSNIYDLNNGLLGDEELLHSAIGYTALYKMQSEEGSYLRMGTIARMGENQAANISSVQLDEYADDRAVSTKGALNPILDMNTTVNMFDVEVVNLPLAGSRALIVTPLHRPIQANAELIIYNTQNAQWSFFDDTTINGNNSVDAYSTTAGMAGNCSPPGDAQYISGLTEASYCLQIAITDGGVNDIDGVVNGRVGILFAISGNSTLPQSPELDSPVDSSDAPTETNDTPPSEVPDINSNKAKTKSSGGGSINLFSLLLLSILAFTQSVKVIAGPQNGEIVAGTGSIDISENLTTINQASDRLAINWDAFDIGANETVSFVQPSSSSIALNVDYSGSASQLFGSMNANGQVILLNSAGILIGSDASINVGGFLASDMNVDITDFRKGDFTLFDTAPNQGGITNLGDINTTSTNGLYIAGQFFDNQGNITTSNADAHITIADKVIIRTNENGMFGIELKAPLLDSISDNGSLIYNSGSIIAFDGNIYLDLQYSNTIKADAVNNQGLIQAMSINESNGKVFLSATSVIDPRFEIQDIISDSLNDDTAPVEVIGLESDAQPTLSVNTIMPDCNIAEMGADECKKHAAVKRFIGQFLLGEELPK